MDCGDYWLEADVADALECALYFEDLMVLEAERGLQRGPDGEWEALAA